MDNVVEMRRLAGPKTSSALSQDVSSPKDGIFREAGSEVESDESYHGRKAGILLRISQKTH